MQRNLGQERLPALAPARTLPESTRMRFAHVQHRFSRERGPSAACPRVKDNDPYQRLLCGI